MELFRQSESARRSSPFINSAAKRRRVTASGSRAAKKQGNIPAAYWERRTRRLLMRSWLTSPAAGFFLCKKTSFFHRIKLFDRRRAVGQHYPTALSLFKKLLQVVFHRADAGDTEALHQHLGHIRTEKCRQRGAKMDLLYAKIQQGQQYDDRLLLIPGDIIDDRRSLISSRPNTSLSFSAMTASE